MPSKCSSILVRAAPVNSTILVHSVIRKAIVITSPLRMQYLLLLFKAMAIRLANVCLFTPKDLWIIF